MLVKNYQPPDREKVKAIEKKLEKCRNQNNNPDSELYVPIWHLLIFVNLLSCVFKDIRSAYDACTQMKMICPPKMALFI